MVEAFGYQSILNAVIDSQVKEIVVKVFGESAGNGATVICRSGATCSLFCKNTGCLGLEYRCLPGSTCNMSPDGCVEDNSVTMIKGIQCPTRTVGMKIAEKTEEFEREQIVLKTLDDLDYDPNHAILPDSFNCNEEFSCQGQTIFDQNTVACQASEACHGATITNPEDIILSSIGCYGMNINIMAK